MQQRSGKRAVTFIISPVLAVIAYMLIQCHHTPPGNPALQKMIIGEWKLLSVATPEGVPCPFGYRYTFSEMQQPVFVQEFAGFTFAPDSSCDIKMVSPSRYYLEDDSLVVFDPSMAAWTAIKIASLTTDTLRLQVDTSLVITYERCKYPADSFINVDKIVLYQNTAWAGKAGGRFMVLEKDSSCDSATFANMVLDINKALFSNSTNPIPRGNDGVNSSLRLYYNKKVIKNLPAKYQPPEFDWFVHKAFCNTYCDNGYERFSSNREVLRALAEEEMQ